MRYRHTHIQNRRKALKQGLLVFSAILVFPLLVIAQFGNEEMLKRKADEEKRLEEIQVAIGSSESAMRLKYAIESGNHRAILEIPAVDDTVMPYLQLLASDAQSRSRRGSPAFYAHAILAKRGDNEAIDTILSDVMSTNFAVQDSAIEKLTHISNKASYRRLLELLDDTADRISSDDCPDIAWGSKARATMAFLWRSVIDPPRESDRYNVEAWKAWFERNRHLID